MKKIYLFILFYFTIPFLYAQSPKFNDSLNIIFLNQSIDDAVVTQTIYALERFYAKDFVFSHGSGKVEGKEGWLTSVAKGGFIMRHHDSVRVELHPALAIVKGNLEVKKKGKEKIDHYHLSYIRIYALRQKKWWLISHSTISEYHDPAIEL